VINATNVQSGALAFLAAVHGGLPVGLIRNPTTELAVAVAASVGVPASCPR
jgi:hypothetical protein